MRIESRFRNFSKYLAALRFSKENIYRVLVFLREKCHQIAVRTYSRADVYSSRIFLRAHDLSRLLIWDKVD